MAKTKTTDTEQALTVAPERPRDANGAELVLSRTRQTELAVPEWLSEERDLGTDTLKQHVTPPRLKVVQSQKGPAYEQFDEGDVVLTPQGLRLVGLDEPFWFVPVLFFPEYCVINPWELKDRLPMIRERTLDPLSEIAAKARNADSRTEPCPEDRNQNLRFVEYLTWIVVLAGGGETTGMQCAMSWARGEHKYGSAFASLIQMRGYPMWAMVFEGRVNKTKRSNAKGRWHGIDVTNPRSENAPPPLLYAKAEFDAMKEMHLRLREQLAANLVQVEHEDPDEVQSAPLSAAAESM
jgi:hypothetical protein